MKLKKLLMLSAFAVTAAIFTGCSPKDADIKTAVDEKIKSTPAIAGTTADVKDGVATLAGELKDESAKSTAEKEIAGVKGVKSVINNITVTPPPPPPAPPTVVITPDDPLTQSVTDATKDYPTVKATVANGVITLTGDIKKDDLKKLMPRLQSLKPKKVDSKQLTVK